MKGDGKSLYALVSPCTVTSTPYYRPSDTRTSWLTSVCKSPYPGSAYETTSGTGGPERPHGLKFEEPADPSRPDLLPPDAVREGVNPTARSTEPMERGRLASEANRAAGSHHGHHHPHPYRGADWEAPESVPDQNAMMGDIPPKSVIETPKTI